MTQRVVLDANVFVSAAIARGSACRTVNAWLEHQPFELIICPAILEEVADVLARPRIAKRLAPELAAAFVRSIRIAADLVDNPVTADDGEEPLTRDADDD